MSRKETPLDLEQLAPRFATLYGEAQLEHDKTRELVSLASLPPWPGCRSKAGHGWGEGLDKTLGGGVRPGYILAIGASSAGAGKTAFVMQLADGLALRTEKLLREKKPGPLTPVLVASEMRPDELSWRSLARWTSADTRIFDAGRSAAALLAGDELDPNAEVENAFKKAKEALRGEFGASRHFLRLFAKRSSGVELVKDLATVCAQWKEQLSKEHPDRAVWPVVVLDPIQRFQGQGQEVEALNTLVEELSSTARAQGWVVFLTSDTNKPAASGASNTKDKREEGAAAFRGSYKLQHLVDAALYLTRPDEDPDRPELLAVLVKNRRGSSAKVHWPRYQWDVRRARFEPITETLPPVVPIDRAPSTRKNQRKPDPMSEF